MSETPKNADVICEQPLNILHRSTERQQLISHFVFVIFSGSHFVVFCFFANTRGGVNFGFQQIPLNRAFFNIFEGLLGHPVPGAGGGGLCPN